MNRNSIFMCEGEVLHNQALDDQQFLIRVSAPEIVAHALPGHFVHIQCSASLPLRRPMSIMRIGPKQGWFEFLFKIHGRGTEQLARSVSGEKVSCLGPIGVPFRLQGYQARPVLIGGGVGIPPMIFLAEHMRNLNNVSPVVMMGSEINFPFTVKPSKLLLPDAPAEAIACMPLLDDWGIPSRLATHSGFAGCYEGFVTDLARAYISQQEQESLEIFACGPTPMLKAVRELALDFDLPCQISLEEHMACAVGGCAGCNVRVLTEAGPAMKRVCVDGPVFEARDVQFQ
ncbi:MAG: dihydroorotate dehydrogenase electron transfer subunit [Pseudomonadota bacterium]